MIYPTVLLAAPKQGGILQSSGFLDLRSLMALDLTSKANAIDELSLTLFIEHELTRNHKITTMEEAITLLRNVSASLARRWLTRDQGQHGGAITVTQDMLSYATSYEVMLVKMLRTVPETERLQTVSKTDGDGMTLLHHAAKSGNHLSIRVLLALYPESERLLVVSNTDGRKDTVLHHAVYSGNLESIKTIIQLLPESERFQVVRMQNAFGSTMLHDESVSESCEMIQFILRLLPEAERLQLLSIPDWHEQTALHCAAESGNIVRLKNTLSLYQESELTGCACGRPQRQNGITLCCQIR